MRARWRHRVAVVAAGALLLLAAAFATVVPVVGEEFGTGDDIQCGTLLSRTGHPYGSSEQDECDRAHTVQNNFAVMLAVLGVPLAFYGLTRRRRRQLALAVAAVLLLLAAREAMAPRQVDYTFGPVSCGSAVSPRNSPRSLVNPRDCDAPLRSQRTLAAGLAAAGAAFALFAVVKRKDSGDPPAASPPPA